MLTDTTVDHVSASQRSLVFMFAGQGAQYYDMGRELFDNEPIFRQCMQRCDAIAGPAVGRSLLKLLYEDGHRRVDPFDDTRFTHPALFMIQWSVAQLLIERGIRPNVLLGYSIGEFVAATVAGTLSLEEALLLLVDQARLLERLCPPGRMAAVLQPLEVRERFGALFADCEVAAVNYPRHFVVAGRPEAVQRLRAGLTADGMICEILPIQFGFHSTLVDPLEREFKTRAAQIPLTSTAMPIVSSCHGDLAPVAGPDYFWDIVRRPVRFDRALAVLERSGPHTYLDVGPSGTLANFVKYALPLGSHSVATPSLTPFAGDLRSLQRLERAVRPESGGAGAS